MYEVIKTIADEAVEPVAVNELKAFCATAYTDDDAILLPSLITAARDFCETFCNRAFIDQTIEYIENINEPDAIQVIQLPYSGPATITGITVNGTATTDYSTTGSERLTVYITGLVPDSYGNCEVVITYDITVVCPEAVKTAIKNIAKDMYENRSIKPLNGNGVLLLTPFKVY
jgi:hypothetical protein